MPEGLPRPGGQALLAWTQIGAALKLGAVKGQSIGLSKIDGQAILPGNKLPIMFKKIFAPGTHSFSTNLALLILRIWLGATILLNHGISKVIGFHTLSGGFPDTLGLGHLGSLVLVIFAEVVAAGLLVVGQIGRASCRERV